MPVALDGFGLFPSCFVILSSFSAWTDGAACCAIARRYPGQALCFGQMCRGLEYGMALYQDLGLVDICHVSSTIKDAVPISSVRVGPPVLSLLV